MKKLAIVLSLLCTLMSFAQEEATEVLMDSVKVIYGTPLAVSDSINLVSPPSPSATNIITAGVPTGNSSEVGITEGQLNVSLTGAATYSIPIVVPPGINGVVPQIGLTYSSQSGNGLAGYGWNITGISTITRIPATKYHDGFIDAVDFDKLDRFALDGQRLIVKQGTSGVYGVSGTEYETENYSNIKIISYGMHPLGSNYGPAYFSVKYPDGSSAVYGYVGTSRSVVEYAISYWQNPQGLRIEYNYSNADNTIRLLSIKYGSKYPDVAINEIAFNYAPRQRKEQQYIGGTSIIMGHILKSINVKGNGEGYRNYYLKHHTTSLGYERLESITEKNGDNSKALNPTVFGYEDAKDEISYNGGLKTQIDKTDISSANTKTVSGDFDGDSKIDFILHPINPDYSNLKSVSLFTNIHYKYYTNNNWNTQGTYNVGLNITLKNFKEIFATTLMDPNGVVLSKQGFVTISEEDSYEKMVFRTYSKERDQILRRYTRTFIKKRTLNYPLRGVKEVVYLDGDFNGDGITDIITFDHKLIKYGGDVVTSDKSVYFINLDRRLNDSKANRLIGTHLETLSLNAKFYVADVNGDGRSDFLIFDKNKVSVYALNPENTQLIRLFTYTDFDILIDESRPILLGDYNGDGKTDFMLPRGYTQYYVKYSSNGRGFYKAILNLEKTFQKSENWKCVRTYQIIPNDFNSDGKTDLYFVNNSSCIADERGFIEVHSFINTGTTFMFSDSATTYNLSEISYYAIPVFLNFDRYNPDLELSFISKNNIFSFQSKKDFNQERLLRNITTGNGVKQVVTYNPLVKEDCNNNCFSLYNTPSLNTDVYPYSNVYKAPSFLVVSKVEEKSTATYKKQLYSYYGAVSSFELGFLGFRGVSKTNWHETDNQVISSITQFDVYNKGLALGTITLKGYNTYNEGVFNRSDYLTKTLNLYNTDSQGIETDPFLQSNKVFKAKNTIIKNYDGLANTLSQTYIAYDEFNNPKETALTVKNGSNIEKTVQTYINYQNSPTAPYYIGRPEYKKTITTSYPEQDRYTTEENYGYTNHLLTTIKKRGNETDYVTETNQYDSYGNLTQKSISAPNVATRTTQYKYDQTTHRFIKESIDIEGLITKYDYNTSNGQIKTETNPYNLTTTYGYDSWGKKTSVTDYLGKTSTTTYTRSGEKTIIIDYLADGNKNYAVHDDLGRVLKEGYRSLNDQWVLTNYIYDIYNRKTKASEPYIGSSPTQWNSITYDDYGRISTVTSYTGRTETTTYEGLTTRTTDGIKTKTTLKNALGQIIQVTDAPIGGTITYSYYANGNLNTTNYDGITTKLEYDGWGRKTKLIDPSAGTYEYTYNNLGETLTEKTPKGTTTHKIDDFGKIIEKTIVGDLTNSKIQFEYDSETKLLQKTTHQDILNGSVTTYNYGYDNYKRLNFSDESNSYAYFQRATQFDEFGRPLRELYTAINPSDNKRSEKWVTNTYKLGYHWQMIDESTNKVLWESQTTNARGQLVTASMNNGNEVITNTYDTYGFLNKTQHNRVNTNPGNIMTLTTSFDVKRGNLNNRTNSLFNLTENFKYDELDRLKEYPNAEEVIETQTYDEKGRITTNSLGTYKYNNTNKPYQQTELETNPYATHYYENRSSLFFDSLEGNKEYFDAPVSDGYNITAPVRYELRTQYTGGASLRLRGNTAIKSRKAIRINNNQPTQYTYSVWTRGAGTKGQISLLMKTASETQEYTYKDSANTTGDLFNWVKTEKTVTIPADVKEIYIELKNTYTFDYNIYFDDLKIVRTDIANAPLELNITYNAFKSPVEIEEPAIDKYSFLYNINNDRSSMFYGGLQDDKHQRPLQKHYSADGSMEIKRNIQTGEVEFITYIGGDAYSAPLVLKSDGVKQEYLFLHRDYQGSILAITNEEGTVIEKRQFDAWGLLVKVQDQYGNVLDKMQILDRGYTGHEHLQSIGIIHMNGRLYDAKLHRFLQPDNFVQDPYNTQNFNRYGYSWNNPLKYTDPSGEFFWLAPLIYAAVNVAVDLVVNNGKMNFGQIAMSAGMGALSGALGGATTSATAFAGAMIGQMNRFLPAIPVYQSEGFSFSISPFIGYGTSGLASGINANVSGQIGEFAYAASVGAGINEGVSSLGESIGSASFWNVGGFVGYNDGHANYGIGYSYNSFGGKMGQGVGSANIQVGDFGFSFINDILGDNGDRGRTAGVQMSYKVNEDITLVGGLSMMTGQPDDEPVVGGNPNKRIVDGKGMYTETKMQNLRSGVLYGGTVYKGQANFYGHNSERRLHSVQNRVHRNWPIYDSPYFPDRGLRSKSYTYSGSYHSNYLYF